MRPLPQLAPNSSLSGRCHPGPSPGCAAAPLPPSRARVPRSGSTCCSQPAVVVDVPPPPPDLCHAHARCFHQQRFFIRRLSHLGHVGACTRREILHHRSRLSPTLSLSLSSFPSFPTTHQQQRLSVLLLELLIDPLQSQITTACATHRALKRRPTLSTQPARHLFGVGADYDGGSVITVVAALSEGFDGGELRCA